MSDIQVVDDSTDYQRGFSFGGDRSSGEEEERLPARRPQYALLDTRFFVIIDVDGYACAGERAARVPTKEDPRGMHFREIAATTVA